MTYKPLLELIEVTKLFRVGGGLGLTGAQFIKAVDHVSFTLGGEAKVSALVGESGSGKSTIANMILGLIPNTSGEILFKRKAIQYYLKYEPEKFRREVQGIFQDPYSVYNPFYRVERVLQVPIRKFKLALNKAEEYKMIVDSLESIGLRPSDIIGRYPHQLSGGERQRLMLARILLLRPSLIIADEPVSMLDASLRAIFLDQIRKFKVEHNISCLYITHDLNIANYIADDITVLCLGNIVEKGKTREVIKNPKHPYTQTLIDSIPIPDPHKRWKDKMKTKVATLAELTRKEQGCVFQPRCPYAMDVCAKVNPSLKEVEKDHQVACFLY